MRSIIVTALLAAPAFADEGWVTHAVALSPNLESTVRGRMHAERGTSRLRIENAETGAVRVEQGASGPVRAFAFRGDGARFVATTDQFGKVYLWDTASGKQLRKLDTGDNRWSFVVAFSCDGTRIAAGAGRVRVFEPASGKVLATLEVHKKRATAIAFSVDGSRLATADADRRIRLWRIADGGVERTWTVKRSVGALVFSANGRTLGGATYCGKCHFRDLSTGREIMGLRPPERACESPYAAATASISIMSSGSTRPCTPSSDWGGRVPASAIQSRYTS